MPADAKQDTPAPIAVRAIAVGFYGDARKRIGDEFTVRSEKDIGTWMERVEPPTKPAKK